VVGTDEVVYFKLRTGEVFMGRENGAGRPYNWTQISTDMTTIAIKIGDDGGLWRLAPTEINFYSPTDPVGWQHVVNYPERRSIMVASGYDLFIVADKAIHRATMGGGPSAHVQVFDTPIENIATSGLNLYILFKDGGITLCRCSDIGFFNEKKQILDQKSEHTVEIASTSTTLYKRHRTGHVYAYSSTSKSWTLIDDHAQTEQIVCDRHRLYQRRAGTILVFTESPISPWQQLYDSKLDQNISVLQTIFAGDSNIFRLHTDGKLFALV